MHTLCTRALAAALALLAGSAAASAGSVTWYSSIGTINSRGLRGDANNTVISVPLPSTSGVGTSWSYLSVTGNLTRVNAGTYASEACIEITLPNGSTMIVKPFQTGTFSGTIAVPPGANMAPPYSMFSGGGMCTLRFFELYADNTTGPDAAWSNLTFTLHDDNDGYPFDMSPMTTTLEPDADWDGVWFTRGVVSNLTFDFQHDRVVNAYRFRGYGTALCGWLSSLSTSPLGLARFTVTADRADGAGTVSWSINPFDQHAASTSNFDITGDTPAPVLIGVAHPWHYQLAESSPAPTTNGTRLASIWYSMQPLAGNGPAAIDLGTVRGNPSLGPAASTVVKSETFLQQPGEVHWYTFDTEQECSNATGYWLDVHSEIPAGSPVIDHEMAVYDTHGQRLVFDDDGGSFGQSMLTFGQTSPTRPAVNPAGGPEPRAGQDGVLPAGQHSLGVSEFYAPFAPTGWFATSSGTHTGQVRIDFRTNLPSLPCGSADIAGQGAVPGADGVLDNNDFVVFIDRFFAHDPSADVGTQGGVPGQDGQWNNNDFVVFINDFFAGCV